MKSTVPTYRLARTITMCILISCCAFITTTFAQTQAPSVRTGATFQWDATQPTTNDPAVLNSITIDGEVFQSFAVPSSYALTRLGPDGHDKNTIIQNGTNVNTNSSNATWNADALAAFQDKNFNHYFESNNNGRDLCNDFSAVASTDAQIQSLYYNPGIPSNAGGIVAISERNANNCYYISVYGVPAGGGPDQFLGDTFVRANSTQWGPITNAPPADVDYWNSGRVVENNGTIGIAIFQLEDLAPVGSLIKRVDLMAATIDHGDGKFFILQKYAVPKAERSCMNVPFNGTLDGKNVPSGSTFTVTSGPTPAGASFTFSPDGSYTYTPTVGFLGDVTFEYTVCLPAPNDTTCDTSTVTITYERGADVGCECSSGNADAPLLQN